MHFRTPLTISYSNFANNRFASACDSRRPIIGFGTCFSVFSNIKGSLGGEASRKIKSVTEPKS